jgi:hypothetical protein
MSLAALSDSVPAAIKYSLIFLKHKARWRFGESPRKWFTWRMDVCTWAGVIATTLIP